MSDFLYNSYDTDVKHMDQGPNLVQKWILWVSWQAFAEILGWVFQEWLLKFASVILGIKTVFKDILMKIIKVMDFLRSKSKSCPFQILGQKSGSYMFVQIFQLNEFKSFYIHNSEWNWFEFKFSLSFFKHFDIFLSFMQSVTHNILQNLILSYSLKV